MQNNFTYGIQMTYGANGKDIKHSFTLSDGILNCILHMNASQCDRRIVLHGDEDFCSKATREMGNGRCRNEVPLCCFLSACTSAKGFPRRVMSPRRCARWPYILVAEWNPCEQTGSSSASDNWQRSGFEMLIKHNLPRSLPDWWLLMWRMGASDTGRNP